MFICSFTNQLKVSGSTELHHICPRSADLFPEYASLKEFPWNGVHLTKRQHFIAHYLLAKAYGGKQMYAFWAMCNKQSSYNSISTREYTVNSKEYEYARKNIQVVVSAANKGKAVRKNLITGEVASIHVSDDRLSSGDWVGISHGIKLAGVSANKDMINCVCRDGTITRVTRMQFEGSENFHGMQHGTTAVIDINTNARQRVSLMEYRNNPNLKSVTQGMKTIKNIETNQQLTILLSDVECYAADIWVDYSSTGFYHTPIGKFSNSNNAKLVELGTPTSIIKWCTNCDAIINRRTVIKPKWASRDMIGKTFREIGFYFVPFS